MIVNIQDIYGMIQKTWEMYCVLGKDMRGLEQERKENLL